MTRSRRGSSRYWARRRSTKGAVFGRSIGLDSREHCAHRFRGLATGHGAEHLERVDEARRDQHRALGDVVVVRRVRCRSDRRRSDRAWGDRPHVPGLESPWSRPRDRPRSRPKVRPPPKGPLQESGRMLCLRCTSPWWRRRHSPLRARRLPVYCGDRVRKRVRGVGGGVGHVGWAMLPGRTGR